ncbi:MAG TPA: DUF4097 family beta strand repeat-containing protein [Xanthomonadaceae bacterium]
MPRLLRSFAAIALVLPAVAFAATVPVTQTRGLSPDGEVSIDNAKGAVVVRVSDQPEVRISGMLGEGVEKLAVEGDRRHLRIRVVNPRPKGWLGSWAGVQSGPTRLLITVPAHASVVIEGVSAAMDVKGVAGRRLSMNSVDGSMQVDASPGEAHLESVSGEVHARLDTGKLRAGTVNGDLDLQGHINGEVSLETVSGHIVLRADKPSDIDISAISGDAELHTGLAPGGQLKAESTSGDLTLMLPAASSAQLQLHSFAGEIDSDAGDVSKPEHGSGSSLEARIGKGEGSVDMTSFSGDVSVKLAGAKLD